MSRRATAHESGVKEILAIEQRTIHSSVRGLGMKNKIFKCEKN